ncbi:hypothetical protein GOP47_0009607 [Adiantum capillus-veneris]|uniref:Glucan endo-1,3-beta-D-glucosidase n=1 Tax=Adiantum capillus-veneris TaxID=13818 RepID=A0A9D4UX45_ADICA|nr:hypothetical protein GOP47_0009607 [Adiantum capillus-veneris]
MARRSSAFLVLLLTFAAQTLCTVSAGNYLVGINYNGPANFTSLPPSKAVALIKSLGVRRVRLADADAHVLAALAKSGLDVVIVVPDEDIPALAASENNAIEWIQKNVIAFFPETHITALNVGDNIFDDQHLKSLWVHLLPAMTNLQTALRQQDLTNLIKVTTSFSMDVFSVTFPPTAGTFRADIAKIFIAPILDFLTQTKTPLYLNVYPYLDFQKDPNHIPLSFALFNSPGIPTWLDNNLSYYNLLDAQLDAAAFAMEGLGYSNIDIVISATGWPTAGGPGASMTNAFKYNQGLVNKVVESPRVGTPHRPKKAVPAFINALVDDSKSGLKWGVFSADGSMAYPLQVWQWKGACSPAQSPGMGPAMGPVPAKSHGVSKGAGDSTVAPAASPDYSSDSSDAPHADDNSAPAPSVHGDYGLGFESPAPGPSSPAAGTHPLLPRCVLLMLLAALWLA